MDTAATVSLGPAPSYSEATVADAMGPLILTCEPATPLIAVARRMAAEHVPAIVVLTAGSDDQRWPWGVVTDADLVRHADGVAELTAGEAASGITLLTHPGEPLAAAARRLVESTATHALVVDRMTGRPVGVLSTLDVTRVIAHGDV